MKTLGHRSGSLWSLPGPRGLELSLHLPERSPHMPFAAFLPPLTTSVLPRAHPQPSYPLPLHVSTLSQGLLKATSSQLQGLIKARQGS